MRFALLDAYATKTDWLSVRPCCGGVTWAASFARTSSTDRAAPNRFGRDAPARVAWPIVIGQVIRVRRIFKKALALVQRGRRACTSCRVVHREAGRRPHQV